MLVQIVILCSCPKTYIWLGHFFLYSEINSTFYCIPKQQMYPYIPSLSLSLLSYLLLFNLVHKSPTSHSRITIILGWKTPEMHPEHQCILPNQPNRLHNFTPFLLHLNVLPAILNIKYLLNLHGTFKLNVIACCPWLGAIIILAGLSNYEIWTESAC